ncbi:sensor histidine kinase [Microbacterium sp. C7(2022)]|uniref:sensor histidine kinase n=1 Tax=Microbacterium sp. C7(2022) TaxID=2992759 RepID=UPI00237C0E99|nr:ATP-binding protein [Microbacterium sp. C7(2022)]MDE0547337.1 ATP-binding protein [Microbacterium sp. C7(2022)]
MSADEQTLLERAWDHIPSTRESTQGIGSFTRTRVERIISLAAGLGSLALGTQAFVEAIGSTDALPAWQLPLMLVAFGTLAVMVLACFVGRGVRLGAGAFAVSYVLVLTVWPIATQGLIPTSTHQPWIWFLVNIATLAAVLAFPMPLQVVWTIIVPLWYGIVRVIQGEFARETIFATALDVSFALILGGVILTLGWLFRSMAANVDGTRARAVTSYGDAAAADAAEHERAEVAALMHDSVLAALIAAERARTDRERTLATAMARDALTRLANAENDPREGSDDPSDAATVAHDLEAAARDLGRPVEVEGGASSGLILPGRIGRALTLAATQAIANSLQHAGGEGLRVAVSTTPTRIEITVSDAGSGFDVHAVPDDRLGIKASIIARVAAVGGRASVDSGPHGTLVVLSWGEDAS